MGTTDDPKKHEAGDWIDDEEEFDGEELSSDELLSFEADESREAKETDAQNKEPDDSKQKAGVAVLDIAAAKPAEKEADLPSTERERRSNLGTIHSALSECITGNAKLRIAAGVDADKANAEAKTRSDALAQEREQRIFGPATRAAFEDYMLLKAANKLPDSIKMEREKFEATLVKEHTRSDNVRYVQNNVLSALPLFVERPIDPSKDRDQVRAEMKAEIDRRTAAIQQELKEQRFGPATQEAFKDYLKWIEKRAVPGALRELAEMQMPIPPDCPIKMPDTKFKHVLTPELFRAKSYAGELDLDLGINPNEEPSTQSLEKMNGVFKWLNVVDKDLKEARGEQQDRLLEQQIKEMHLPEQWLDRRGLSKEEWRASANQMVDLSMRMRNYVEAMDTLFKASKYGDFPREFPPGCKPERDERGNIKFIHFDLPTDLRQAHPSNDAKIASMCQWLDKYGDKIDKTLLEHTKIRENPNSIVAWGDEELPKGWKGVLDKDNNFVSICKEGKYTPQNGESIVNANLIEKRVSAQRLASGKIRIDQSVQAQEVPAYAYLNCTWENKGNPAKVNPKEYDPEDFVAINDGNRVQIIKAKHVEGWANLKAAGHYTEKGLTVVMDVSMLVSACVGVGVALSAGRAALKIGTMAMAKELGKDALRFTVAASGIFNNAGARSTDWGSAVNTARGLYFLADVSQGLGRQAWKSTLGKGNEVLSAGQKIEEAARNSNWVVRNLERTSKIGFKGCEYGFFPILAKELHHQIAGSTVHRDPLADGSVIVGDGRGRQHVDKTSFDPQNTRAIEGTSKVLDSYTSTLTTGKQPETAEQVKKILERTKSLLATDIGSNERTAFKQELLQHFFPDGDAVRDAEMKERIGGLSERFRAAQDKDVRAAAAVALLYLSRDAAGNLPETLSTRQVTVKEYERDVVSDHGVDKETVKAHDVTQQFTSEELVKLLKSDLADPKVGTRGLVIGENLVYLNAISGQQFAGVLQDILSDPKSSPSDKMKALTDTTGPRFASIMHGLRLHEQSLQQGSAAEQHYLGKSFGLSYNGLEKTLRDTAGNTGNTADVRAMAAALLHGLSQKDEGKTSALLTKYNAQWQELSAKGEGEFGRTIKSELFDKMNEVVPDGSTAERRQVNREERLVAAVAFRELTAGDAALQKEANKAIVKTLDKLELEPKPPSTAQLKTVDHVIRALMPKHLAEMDKSDPASAHELRMQVKRLLDTRPDTKDHDVLYSGLIEKLPELVTPKQALEGDWQTKNQALAKSIRESLVQYLTKGTETDATHFPGIRSSAVEALGKFNYGDSRALIRQILDVNPDVADPDGKVRLAAVNALSRMKDPELVQIALSRMPVERDHAVAIRLQDIKFTEDRLRPTEAEYDAEYQKLSKQLITSSAFFKAHPGMTDFADQKMRDWIASKGWDALMTRSFKDREAKVEEHTHGGFWRFWSRQSTIDREERLRVQNTPEERDRQWEELVKMAHQDDEDGLKAKAVLFRMIIEPGSVFNGDDSAWVQKYAVQDFVKLCQRGVPHRNFTAYCMQSALTADNVSNENRLKLLEGLRELGKPDKNNLTPLPRVEMSHALYDTMHRLAGLKTGLRPNPAVMNALMDDLTTVGHRAIFPILDSLIDDCKDFPETQRKAKALLPRLRDSVNLQWDETTKDTGTIDDQAKRLKSAISQRYNSEKMSQEIANCCKDNPLQKPDAEGLPDARLPALKFLMNDTNDRVRLSAARAIAESMNNYPSEAIKALQVLQQIRIKGSETGYRDDAAQLLDRFSQNIPKNGLQGKLPDGGTLTALRLSDGIHVSDGKDSKVRKIWSPHGELDASKPADCLREIAKIGTIIQDNDPRLQLLKQSLTDGTTQEKDLAAALVVRSAAVVDAGTKEAALARCVAMAINKQKLVSGAGDAIDAALNKDVERYAGEVKSSFDERLRACHQALNHPEKSVQLAAAEFLSACPNKGEFRRYIDDSLDVLLGATFSGTDLEKQRAAATLSKTDPNLLLAAHARQLEKNTTLTAAQQLSCTEQILQLAPKATSKEGIALQVSIGVQTLAQLSIHPDKTVAEKATKALSAIDQPTRTKALEHLKLRVEMTMEPAKVSGLLDVPAILYNRSKADARVEATLYATYLSAQKTLGDKHQDLDKVFKLIDRRGSSLEGFTPIADQEDPRYRLLLTAAKNGNDSFRYNAALCLTDNPKLDLSKEDREQAYAVMHERIKELQLAATEAAKGTDASAKLSAWRALERTYERHGFDITSLSYLEAKTKRMECEFGPKHKELAPYYEQIADAYEKAESPRLAKEFRAKAKDVMNEGAGAAELQKAREELVAARGAASTASGGTEVAQVEQRLQAIALQFKTKLGPKAPEVADTLLELGKLYGRTNQHEKAEATTKEALEIFGAQQDRIPETASTLAVLARTYAARGMTSEFQDTSKKMLDVSKWAGSTTVSIQTQQTLQDLADYVTAARNEKEMLESAGSMMTQAVELSEKSLGKDNQTVIDNKIKLADFYGNSSVRNHSQAKTLYRDVLDALNRQTGGFQTAKHGMVAANLAAQCKVTGDNEGTEKYFEQAMEAFRNDPTANPAVVTQIRMAYVTHLQHYGKVEQAQRVLNGQPAGGGNPGSMYRP